jgi:hypothetical protein
MGAGKSKVVVEKQKQAILNSKGCWLGNIQCPLLPETIYAGEDISKKSPFLQIRVLKRLDPAKDDNTADIGVVRLWLESKHLKYCSFSMHRQDKKTGDLVMIPSVALPPPNKIDPKTGEELDEYVQQTEEERIISEKTRRQFKFDKMKVNDTHSYIVYIVNSEPVEGEFTVFVNNMSMYHELTVLLPRQFNTEWFEAKALPLETDIKGQWMGFTSYGGAPFDRVENDWLLYNPAYIVSVSKVRIFDFNWVLINIANKMCHHIKKDSIHG